MLTPVNSDSINTETKPPRPFRALIAASGTGGHLLPAVYIAQALRRRAPEAEILFVGSGKPLEGEIIDKAGFSRRAIRIVGLKHRGIKGAFEFLGLLPSATLEVWSLLREFSPHVVIGVGGYATVLPIILGRMRGVRTWIHEAERRPGMANYALSFIAERVSVAFHDAAIPCASKKVFTGQPVRSEIAAMRSEEREVPSPPRHLLILGGSQGAQALDQLGEVLAPWFGSIGLKIYHQCRAENQAALTSAYQASGVLHRVESFIQDLVPAYRWADLVLCRAGAGTIMEIGVVNLPTIFVPYPHAQGNHQLANARVLADVGKAVIEEEGEDFTVRIRRAIEKLIDPHEYMAMKARPLVGRPVDAADEIARRCVSRLDNDSD